MWWMIGLVAGCGPRFESPWDEAVPTEQRVSGWALTELDNPSPGAGWFRTRGGEAEVEGHDFSWATLREVKGASTPVVVIAVGGLEPGGDHTVLELDVALPAWVAGELPVDGDASIGQLRTPDGNDPFVLGGTIDVVAAGARPGERVEIRFTDLVLAEVP